MNKKFDQIEIRANENEAKVFLNMPSFHFPMHLATLSRDTMTLKLVPKNSKNVFHFFKDGLGFNEEMIFKLKFKFVEAELNGTAYRTTRDHLIKKAVRSPYQSVKVDRQLILRLSDFHIPSELAIKSQEELFAGS